MKPLTGQFSVIHLATICITAIFLGAGCEGTFKESRGPFMPLMDADLHTYASDHGGWFPNDTDQSKALAKLYPGYSYGVELAGLSGNIQQVTNALWKGISISNLTSWTYVSGLRVDDDPQLAILWEVKPGLTTDGYSGPPGERLVLLLSSDITNVPAANWENFLKKQEQLRKAVQSSRKTLNGQ